MTDDAMTKYQELDRQRENERTKRANRLAKRRMQQKLRRKFPQEVFVNHNIKMQLTGWTYDEFGNMSRVLYREE